MKLIDKDALVAEIEKREGLLDLDNPLGIGGMVELECLKDTIDTLEVKEADLEQEIRKVQKDYKTIDEYEGYFSTIYASDIEWIAKHFFDLGLRASNPLTWEDIMLIHKCIKDAMNFKLYKMMEGIEGQKEVYEEVLKRFKTQKGEKV